MRHVVVGTAGHIDHGKSALVRALTGTDPDRLPEERRRGITIELGFAVLEEAGLRIHFVDVPGHERLVHTMIAGAGGIDLALLVVAADEGVMPQTREHLEVIRFMGVLGGVVALTKVDLVDPDLAALAAEELRELLAGGPFEDAPVVPVSAVTGQGLAELRQALARAAGRCRPRPVRGRPFRLPVDRVFTRPGAGTVVTGTALWGRLRAGDGVRLLPGRSPARVRRLQVHGQERQEVEAGERVAVALAGVRHEDIRRGDQLLGEGPWRAVDRVAVRLELLPRAPGALDEGAEVELHALAARTAARVERLASRPLVPGDTTVAVLRLAAPMALFPGDRGVLRRPAPVNTFAGVLVLDPDPPRLRRREATALLRLPGPARPAWPELVRRWIAGAGLAGIGPDGVAARLGTDRDATEGLLGRVVEEGGVTVLPTRPPRLVAEQAVAALARRARAELERRLAGEVATTGIPARDFIGRLLPQEAAGLAEHYLEELRQRGTLALVGGRVVPPGRTEHLTEAGQELVRRVERAYLEAGLDPPSPEALAASLGARRAVVEGICRYLVERGALVRLGGRWLIHRSALDGVEAAVRAWPRPTLEIGEFKERFRLTRKLAIPILEWLDGRRITVRRGPARAILKRDRTGDPG